MIRKVLFILPSVGTGGFVSSYIPLYLSIKGRMDVKTLFLVSDSGQAFPYRECVIKDCILSSYYDSFSSLSTIQKLLAVFLKYLKKKNQAKGIGLSEIVGKCVAKRLMKKHHFDLVVGFSEGSPARLTSYFVGIKKISWIHCDYKRYHEVVCQNHDELDIYRRIDRIVCVSKFTKKSFIDIYPSLSNRVISIYNLLDVDRIKKMSHESIDDNRFQKNTFNLISIGRIDPVKRFSSIPKIARGMKDAGLKFRWYILGPDSNANEAKLLSDHIIKYNVSDTVYWLGGKTNPYTYLAHSNLYVCLSSSEACPMVFNEAKVLGIPIVTTNFGSAYEFIQDGVNGIITELDSLQRTLSTLIRDEQKINVLKNGIREAGFNNSAILQQLGELIH